MPQAVFREQRDRGGSNTALIFALAFFSRLDFEACLIGPGDSTDRIESIHAFVRAFPIQRDAFSVFAGCCQTGAPSSKRANLTSYSNETLRQRDGVRL